MYSFQKLCVYIFFEQKFICMHIFCRIKGSKKNFGSYMRTTAMENAQWFYSHDEEFRGFHVSMGNVETDSKGRGDRKTHVTMMSLRREVNIYRVDN
jgi:hypothetical protein